jgi:hypothetical protein
MAVATTAGANIAPAVLTSPLGRCDRRPATATRRCHNTQGIVIALCHHRCLVTATIAVALDAEAEALREANSEVDAAKGAQMW